MMRRIATAWRMVGVAWFASCHTETMLLCLCETGKAPPCWQSIIGFPGAESRKSAAMWMENGTFQLFSLRPCEIERWLRAKRVENRLHLVVLLRAQRDGVCFQIKAGNVGCGSIDLAYRGYPIQPDR